MGGWRLVESSGYTQWESSCFALRFAILTESLNSQCSIMNALVSAGYCVPAVTVWHVAFVLQEGNIPTSSNIAKWTYKYFKKHKRRTARVLAGPKRETWFSAEMYAALCLKSSSSGDSPYCPDFSCWGEQQFSTLLAKVREEAKIIGLKKRRPDIICYLPIDKDDAIDSIIEIKLLLSNKNFRQTLGGLKKQMIDARKLSSHAKVLGMIFLVAAPYRTPGICKKSIENLQSTADSIFREQEGFSWVEGYRVISVFDKEPTNWFYPKMLVSLALGVIELI